MSEIGIIAISVVVGMFLLLLVGAGAAMIYLLYSARKVTTAFASQVGALQTSIMESLDTNHKMCKAYMEKLNGEALLQAAKTIPPAVRRMEQAALAFGELTRALISDRESSDQPPYGPGPEEYAPATPGDPYYSVSRTARADSETPEIFEGS
jgi:hypothetical protein